jgi:hypothetical protein
MKYEIRIPKSETNSTTELPKAQLLSLTPRFSGVAERIQITLTVSTVSLNNSQFSASLEATHSNVGVPICASKRTYEIGRVRGLVLTI